MSDTRDSILERLMTGDLEPDSPGGRHAFSEHEGLREEYEELVRTADHLSRTSREVVAARNEARMRSGAPGEEEVVAKIHELARQQGEGGAPGSAPTAEPMKSSFSWYHWASLAAAAVLIFLLGAWMADRDDRRRDDTLLGGTRGQLTLVLATEGEWQPPELRWEVSGVEDVQGYQVLIYDDTPEARTQPLSQRELVRETVLSARWSLAPGSSVPDRVLVRIEVECQDERNDFEAEWPLTIERP